MATPHLWLYVVPGTPGARDAAMVAQALEPMVARLSGALGGPGRVVYPLYPSVEVFAREWWRFAAPQPADAVHGWGAVYTGDPGVLSPYPVARALAAAALAQAVPLLRWGWADAMADRELGVDPHRHVAALRATGRALPAVERILPPADFGQALPWSYPVAVSFVADLVDRFGPRATAQFARAVGYRYFDLPDLFRQTFGISVGEAAASWHERVLRVPAQPVDAHAYAAASRLAYRVGLARSPAAVMLEPAGAEVVVLAAAATVALRRLDLEQAAELAERARRAQEREVARQARRTLAARGLLVVLATTPVVLAALWLLWPAVRGRLAGRPGARGRRASR